MINSVANKGRKQPKSNRIHLHFLSVVCTSIFLCSCFVFPLLFFHLCCSFYCFFISIFLLFSLCCCSFRCFFLLFSFLPFLLLFFWLFFRFFFAIFPFSYSIAFCVELLFTQFFSTKHHGIKLNTVHSA